MDVHVVPDRGWNQGAAIPKFIALTALTLTLTLTPHADTACPPLQCHVPDHPTFCRRREMRKGGGHVDRQPANRQPPVSSPPTQGLQPPLHRLTNQPNQAPDRYGGHPDSARMRRPIGVRQPSFPFGRRVSDGQIATSSKGVCETADGMRGTACRGQYAESGDGIQTPRIESAALPSTHTLPCPTLSCPHTPRVVPRVQHHPPSPPSPPPTV